MSGRVWIMVIDWLGRPRLTNADRRAHHHEVAAHRRLWREAGAQAARLARVPGLGAVEVTVQGRYPDGRLPDADACAPSVKGVIDGLVDAGVIPDDGPERVRSVTYLRARTDQAAPAALVVRIEEVIEDEGPERGVLPL